MSKKDKEKGAATLTKSTVRTSINPSSLALWEAARSDNLDHIKELIARGVGVAAKDQDGGTVLHHAAECGSMRVLSYLVGLRKAEFLNITDRFGMTALYRACAAGRFEAAAFLIQSGSDPTISTTSGLTSFKRAAQIMGEAKAKELEGIWEAEGRSIAERDKPEPATDKGVKTVWGDKVFYAEDKGKTLTKSEAKGLFQTDVKTEKDELDEQKRREQELMEKEIESYVTGNEGKNLTKRLALHSATPNSVWDQLDTVGSGYLDAPAQDSKYLPVVPAPLKIVAVSRDNFIDLDDLTDAISEFVYIVVSVIASPSAEHAQPLYPKLNDSLKYVAEQVKSIFGSLATFVQPFILNQKNRIIQKAKGLQDSLKYSLDSVKEVQTKHDRASAQKLLNTTQILMTDVVNFYQSAEYIWPEAVSEQLALSHANLANLQAWFEPDERGRFKQNSTAMADEVNKLVKWILGDVVRLTALVTQKAYEKRDNEYQTALSDSLFFVARACKGVGIIAEKLLVMPGNEELRDKLATLIKAIVEQLTKIGEITAYEVRENLPPPIFNDSEVAEYTNKYHMAFKELSDAYQRFVEDFSRFQQEREAMYPPSQDPNAEPLPDFILSERRESVALLKVIITNVGVIKEIFSRPSSTELMKTMRSLTQAASRFAVNQYRSACECDDAVLRELIMVSLQATLLLGVALKSIASSKAVAHPLFLIEPSMMASVRSLCSILVLCIDACVEWENMKRDGRARGKGNYPKQLSTLYDDRKRDTVNVSDSDLNLVKLKILSYGRILSDPTPKYVSQPTYKPIEISPLPAPEPFLAQPSAASAGGLSMASPGVKIPVSPIARAPPAAAAGRPVANVSQPVAAASPGRSSTDKPPAPAAASAPSAAPAASAGKPRVDEKGRLLPSIAAPAVAPISSSLGPAPNPSDVEAYKQYMIRKYEMQARENAEILRKKKEAAEAAAAGGQ